VQHTKSQELTRERFEKRIGRGPVSSTPFGRELVASFLEPLAAIIAAKLGRGDPDSPFAKLQSLIPRDDFGALLRQLEPGTLALMALAAVLPAIDVPCSEEEAFSREMLFRLEIGRGFFARLELNRLLKSRLKADRTARKEALEDLTRTYKQRYRAARYRQRALKFLTRSKKRSEYVKAGDWLLQCLNELDAFDYEGGVLIYSPEYQTQIDRLRKEMMFRDPILLPHTTKPRDVTGWRTRCDDRLSYTFVNRDWSKKDRRWIDEAFRSSNFRHARGLNALKDVPLVIDEWTLNLVERYALKVTNPPDIKNARNRLGRDVESARSLLGGPIWLTYSCDWRGRVYANEDLNYQREDHIRSLFRFAEGAPLGPDGIKWLEVHAANCYGEAAKETWEGHTEWIANIQAVIEDVAAYPDKTFNIWSKADNPFAFLAACRELLEAYADPDNFVTTLPIPFDHTCSGIQHLALMGRDEKAGALVNLVDADNPQRIYSEVASLLKVTIEGDHTDMAAWWRGALAKMSDKQITKLVKRPVMTFPYGVTEGGMAQQVRQEYRELQFDGKEKHPKSSMNFLAKKIIGVVSELLPGPVAIMDYLSRLDRHYASQDKLLEWDNPSDFHVTNRYNKTKVDTVYLPGGTEFRVANGDRPELEREKSARAAAPNFVHSHDAAHLILTVLGCVEVGITNIVTVHDSFAVLAPQAALFHAIDRRELAQMYWDRDVLDELHKSCRSNSIAPPPKGALDLKNIEKARWIAL
jgi:hypothetical protein